MGLEFHKVERKRWQKVQFLVTSSLNVTFNIIQCQKGENGLLNSEQGSESHSLIS